MTAGSIISTDRGYNMKKVIILLMLLTLLGGCTKRAWYDGFQAGQKHQCGKLEGESREKCLQNADMSYEEYKKNRK